MRPTLILKVSSLFISKTPFSPSFYIIWSSEPRVQQLDIKVPTASREGSQSLRFCSIFHCNGNQDGPQRREEGARLRGSFDSNFIQRNPIMKHSTPKLHDPVSDCYGTLDALHPDGTEVQGKSVYQKILTFQRHI